jgi:uncharacterized protein (UPF0548 family)
MTTEWRFLRGWPSEALRVRLDRLRNASHNFAEREEEMTAPNGWHRYASESTIARGSDHAGFARAVAALANYDFSDPRIVRAHFDPTAPLASRRMLLEIRVLGLRYLCPTTVMAVRDEAHVFGFGYATLEGHIERGIEWFVLTRNDRGDIRFSIEARWQRGDFPNWWSRVGFVLLAGHYQRTWHRRAHQRLSLLSQFGSLTPPSTDAAGLTHQDQGGAVTFTHFTPETRAMDLHPAKRIVALGAITGIRSTAGIAALTMKRRTPLRALALLAAAVELVLDKTSVVGNRTDALPLAGRAVLGAALANVASRRGGGGGGLSASMLGCATAILTAHLATRARRRLPVSNLVGGLLEDAVVLTVASSLATSAPRHHVRTQAAVD